MKNVMFIDELLKLADFKAFQAAIDETVKDVIVVPYDPEAGASWIENYLDTYRTSLGINTYVVLTADSCMRKNFPNNAIVIDNAGLTPQRVNDAIYILTSHGMNKSFMKNAPHKVWLVSDTHFCHANIIKYCNRPFADVNEMNEKLVENWNSVVKADDIVWCLGDFCFGRKENAESVFPKLNGSIRLVVGNHDHHKMKFYYDLGFKKVYDRPVLVNGFFMLSHAPIEWLSMTQPLCNIFGHVHDNPMYKTFTPRSACVCVERWNYTPVEWDAVIEGMKKVEQNDGIRS